MHLRVTFPGEGSAIQWWARLPTLENSSTSTVLILCYGSLAPQVCCWWSRIHSRRGRRCISTPFICAILLCLMRARLLISVQQALLKSKSGLVPLQSNAILYHPLPLVHQLQRQGLRGLFALECVRQESPLSLSLCGCLINMTDTIAQSLHVNTAHSHSCFITLIYSV